MWRVVGEWEIVACLRFDALIYTSVFAHIILDSIVFSMLSTPEASLAVFEGEDGTLSGVSSGKMIIDCATLAESDMKRMSEQVGSRGG